MADVTPWQAAAHAHAQFWASPDPYAGHDDPGAAEEAAWERAVLAGIDALLAQPGPQLAGASAALEIASLRGQLAQAQRDLVAMRADRNRYAELTIKRGQGLIDIRARIPPGRHAAPDECAEIDRIARAALDPAPGGGRAAEGSHDD